MLGKYWKAWIALLGTVTTAVVAISVDPSVTSVLPQGWSGAVVAAGAFLTALLTASKANTPDIDQVDALLDKLPVEDAKAIVAKWQAKLPKL